LAIKLDRSSSRSGHSGWAFADEEPRRDHGADGRKAVYSVIEKFRVAGMPPAIERRRRRSSRASMTGHADIQRGVSSVVTDARSIRLPLASGRHA
jgi:hypothetical protein